MKEPGLFHSYAAMFPFWNIPPAVQCSGGYFRACVDGGASGTFSSNVVHERRW